MKILKAAEKMKIHLITGSMDMQIGPEIRNVQAMHRLISSP
jgi:hypothetical protein